MTEAQLREVLLAAAAELDGVTRRSNGHGLELVRDGRSFAIVGLGSASFRLDGPVAAAARRTQDVTPSSLGPEWVEFAPRTLDQFALDRATAWLEAAWRRAGAVAR